MSYSPYVLPAERLEDPVTAEAILEYHGKTFHFASRLLGSRHRTRAARLYAFCRHADDLADNATDTDQARQALSALREDLVLDRPSTRQAADLLELSREIDLPMQAPIALIDGALKDLVDPIMQSERDLIRYAYHVAGSVGLMMCAALDVRDPRAWPHAIDLGIAMQLTNIARDVGEDAAMGRRYLPGDWIEHAQPGDILAPDPVLQAHLRAAVARLIAISERYYQSGLQGLGFLPRGARWGILVAGHLYREIGHRIVANNHVTWDQRIFVSRPRKVWKTGLLLSGKLLSPGQRPRIHDASLHQHLDQLFGADHRPG